MAQLIMIGVMLLVSGQEMGLIPTISAAVPVTVNDVSAFNWCGPTKSIALTFDDSQFIEPSITDLLNDLARLKITATFFMTPDNDPPCDTIRRVLADGHTLQDHTMSHFDSTTLTAEQMEFEVSAVPNWIQSTCGIQVTMNQFRPPFNLFSHDLALQTNQLGFTIASWTLASHDSDDYTLEQAQNAINEQFDALPAGSSAIILNHDNNYTEQGVKGIIDFFAAKFRPLGYKFVSMAHCFQQCLSLGPGACQAPPNTGPGLWEN